jgi:hypothetical protein
MNTVGQSLLVHVAIYLFVSLFVFNLLMLMLGTLPVWDLVVG